MPVAFEDFQGKGVLDFSSSISSDSLLSQQQLKEKGEQNWLINNCNRGNKKANCCYVGSTSTTTEPRSVLDNRRSSSPLTSSSTLSSSRGGGGGGGGGGSSSTGFTATNVSSNPHITATEKCGGLELEDWEGVLPGSPNQGQSILGLIMGDTDDPSLGLNNLPQDMEFSAGFGVLDQASFGFETPFTSSNNLVTSSIDSDFGNNSRFGSVSNQGYMFSSAAANLLPQSVIQHQPVENLDEKPQMLNSQVIINQNQAQYAQNPALFLPLSYAQMQEHQLLSPPPPKRLNLGPKQKVPFSDSGQQELFLRRQQQQQQQQQQQLYMPHQRQTMAATATKQKMVNDELANQQLQQEAIMDQIFKASELIETGNNPVLAQGILARLNDQLSPIGKPFQRAAFYFKEALQLLLHMSMNNSSAALSGYSVIFKISAYKSFSEISPILQFANFTCNQTLLEAFEGCNRIHIIDFDIGYGGQWSSLMQELVLRSEGPPSLKITAFASPSTHDELELSFTQENLKHFARELNIPFEIEILSLEALNSVSWPLPLQGEVTAVNLLLGTFSNYPATLPLVLRFVKQLSPKIVVSSDRGCDRTDVPFPRHMIHALQSYSGLLESLDAVNVNLDTLQKIERFLVYPCIEKIVLGRHRSPGRLPPWKSLFMQSGFAPLTFSNFTESQADCLVQRTPVRGFHVEKRQASLVLCWQRKELISATAWRC